MQPPVVEFVILFLSLLLGLVSNELTRLQQSSLRASLAASLGRASSVTGVLGSLAPIATLSSFVAGFLLFPWYVPIAAFAAAILVGSWPIIRLRRNPELAMNLQLLMHLVTIGGAALLWSMAVGAVAFFD